MRILTIMGTPRQGNTRAITDLFLQEFQGEENLFDEIILPRDFPVLCCGCGNCIRTGEKSCPHHDLIDPILERILLADLIVVATPVFVMSCSSALKTLLDHLAYIWLVHRPKEAMFHKAALIVTTAGGSGVRQTVQLIKNNLFYWGVPTIYHFSVTTMQMGGNYIDYRNKDKIQKQVRSTSNRIKRSLIHRKICLKTKLFFHVFRITQYKGWNKTDADYWKAQGWLNGKSPF